MMDLALTETVKVPLMMDLKIEDNAGSLRMFLVDHYHAKTIFEVRAKGENAKAYSSLHMAINEMRHDDVAQFYLQNWSNGVTTARLHLIHFINEVAANQYLVAIY